MTLIQALIRTSAPPAVILIRLIVRGVFVSEGIQKFLFPDKRSSGRFAKIGLPFPHVLGPFVGATELLCGGLILLGGLTRLAAIPLIVTMQVAIATTKLPILRKKGFWEMAHEARTDYAMLLGSIFLLIVGGGRQWSLDSWLARRRSALTRR